MHCTLRSTHVVCIHRKLDLEFFLIAYLRALLSTSLFSVYCLRVLIAVPSM